MCAKAAKKLATTSKNASGAAISPASAASPPLGPQESVAEHKREIAGVGAGQRLAEAEQSGEFGFVEPAPLLDDDTPRQRPDAAETDGPEFEEPKKEIDPSHAPDARLSGHRRASTPS